MQKNRWHGQQMDVISVLNISFWRNCLLSFRLRSFSQNFLIRVFKLSQKFYPDSQLGFFKGQHPPLRYVSVFLPEKA